MTQTEYKIHIDHVIERIEAARIKVSEHHIVKIVAVSKYSDVTAIEKLYKIGQRAFGENKVQDLVSKTQQLEALPLEWHFIGTLQKNKINQLIKTNPFLFQSLDSLELALALDKRLQAAGQTMDALLQINAANEVSKAGVRVEEAKDIFETITDSCPNIRLKGVMSIGAHSNDETAIRESFQKTRAVFDSLNDVSICSMGMSQDFELAIECGSTMVRLGSILFPKEQ